MLPRVDVLEDDAGITLLADLPGVPKDHLELKVEGDALVIEGVMAPFTPEHSSRSMPRCGCRAIGAASRSAVNWTRAASRPT